jgi:hypothetical protein
VQARNSDVAIRVGRTVQHKPKGQGKSTKKILIYINHRLIRRNGEGWVEGKRKKKESALSLEYVH